MLKDFNKISNEAYFQLKSQLDKVAEVYMEIYKEFSQKDSKSYIGLRDFYCLVCNFYSLETRDLD